MDANPGLLFNPQAFRLLPDDPTRARKPKGHELQVFDDRTETDDNQWFDDRYAFGGFTVVL